MIGITKRFPGVLALDNVDLELYKGEIHGLLGENGAGKTTLMNILFGIHQPDSGEIFINGEPVSIHSPADAIRLGIGMVHQHFRLVPPFTVAENIALGLKGGPFVDIKSVEKRVAQLADEYGLSINPALRIQDLSVGEQQRVEILSSLYRGAEVLILDEPTAVLTPQEAETLALGLRRMAEQGKVVVFISHKLDEVLKLTDRVTVLRLGKVVFRSLTRDTNKSELAREMIGHEFVSLQAKHRAHVLTLAGAEEAKLIEKQSKEKEGKVLLEVRDLHVVDDRGVPALRGLNFHLKAGEILGIAGVDGNGQRELAEVLVRTRQVERGCILYDGEDATHWTPRDFKNHGGAYIPEDRQNEGLILSFNLGRNAILKTFDKRPFSNKGLLDFKAITSYATQLIKRFDIRAPGPFVKVKTLSGGNQQKLVLARELDQKPRLIVANKPTRGLDIGAAAYIHQKLLEERERGVGILLISTELEEILLLSDRILVLYNGKSMGELEAQTADIQTIGLMMAGTPLEEIHSKEACP